MDKSWSGVVTIKGVADANSQVKLYDGNTSLGTVSTAVDGSWSFKTSSAISNTVHTYTAKQLDSAGQVVGTSGSAILGSTSNNELKGTSGNDLFTGNGGNDTFVFAANFGNDIIKDFGASSRSHDVIQFSKSVFDNFADVLAHATQVGRDVVISADAGDSVTLKNTKLSAISSNDFHFA
jgi:Ca2+-binding RTX toxin-like protein